MQCFISMYQFIFLSSLKSGLRFYWHSKYEKVVRYCSAIAYNNCTATGSEPLESVFRFAMCLRGTVAHRWCARRTASSRWQAWWRGASAVPRTKFPASTSMLLPLSTSSFSTVFLDLNFRLKIAIILC